MARVTAERVKETKRELLEAAQKVLLEEGYSGLSTRRVAEAANTQMSQIQYHFGSKEGMILALFEYLNAQLIDRQTRTFNNPDLSVSEKWAASCDYLDDDIASGYVRVLMELTAAGWSNPAIGAAVRSAYAEWRALILSLVREVEQQNGSRSIRGRSGFAGCLRMAWRCGKRPTRRPLGMVIGGERRRGAHRSRGRDHAWL